MFDWQFSQLFPGSFYEVTSDDIPKCTSATEAFSGIFTMEIMFGCKRHE